MNTPKVSVVCMVYKHEPYLRQCFDGFVMQKTSFPIEILVNDDCSPDGSAKVMREYEEKYPDLFHCIYQEENQYSKGKMAWWEVLFPMAKGEYIAICEGDDYWIDPYKLQKQVDFMDQHPDYVACFHNARVQYDDHVSLFNALNENHDPTTEDIIKRHWFIATPTLFFRNVLHDYPEWRGEVLNGDYLLELLLAREGKFHYMDDVMAAYRQDGMGMSAVLNRNKVDMVDKLIYLLERMKDYYDGEYASTFDESIRNYQAMRANYAKEIYYEQHPIARLFRPKTYKRMIKKRLRKWLQV